MMETNLTAEIESWPQSNARESSAPDPSPDYTEGFQCKIIQGPNGPALYLRGALNHSGAYRFAAGVEQSLANHPHRIAIDFSGVHAFDSVGLGKLNAAIRKLRNSRCATAVANVPPNLVRAMHLLSLDIGVHFTNDIEKFLSEAS